MTPLTVLHRDGRRTAAVRELPREVAVAVEVNGIGYAVMMMTPADLGDFATGFLLTERLADRAGDMIDHEVVEVAAGLLLRVTLAPHCAPRIADRVRHRTSDTGCGLCGIASLDSLDRPAPAPPADRRITPAALFAALDALRAHQPLNAATGAVHAAALCDGTGAIVAAREDVGRHNALDKLIGAIALGAHDPAAGFVLTSSRISFEMVDKALFSGAPAIVGISGATDRAVDHARASGLTLVALARPDSCLLLAGDAIGE